MDYEKEVSEIKKQNNHYLELFFKDLTEEGLKEKTINRHMGNVQFYLNEFLCYYQSQKMEEGCYAIDEFLGDWFIRKAMWSSKESILSNCASLKKFYKLMLDFDYIQKDSYNVLINTIKSEKILWIIKAEY